MYKYVLSLLCVVSVGHVPSLAVAQNLGGAYSDCSCVTPALSTSTQKGAITSANGDVLVDGVSADTNKLLTANSQVLVGDGNAAITVGQSCQISIPNNTQVSISQPGGPGSNLCIQRLDTGVAQESATFGNGALLGTLVVVGAIAAVVVATSDDDDNNKARPAASP